MKIFSGRANEPIAVKIAKHLEIPLSPVDEFVFPDGERRVRIIDQVVGEDTIIVQSASTPVDEHYMELFFLIDSLRRSGAKSVTVVIPYFGYQRQDHIFRDGEAVSLEVIISILGSLRVDHVISVDMHASRIPDLFPESISVSHLSALPIFAKKIADMGWNDEKTVLVSPDMGGIRRIKMLSELLDGMSWVATEKNRDLETGALQENKLGEGSLEGKTRAIIVDDMISSGGTIANAVSLLKSLGIKDSCTFATHAVFSKEAPRILEECATQKVFVADTVLISEVKQFAKLEVLSVAGEIGESIKEILPA